MVGEAATQNGMANGSSAYREVDGAEQEAPQNCIANGSNGSQAGQENGQPGAWEEGLVDVIVVGAGPAGLSAALLLGRCRRSVIVFDSGEKRNEASLMQHAILGSDGANRQAFLGQAKEQVLRYPTVAIHNLAVTDLSIHAERMEKCTPGEIEAGTCETQLKSGAIITKTHSFDVTTEDGRVWNAKKVVLATGVKDQLPGILAEFWGHGVWVCLFCSGYEYRDLPWGAYGNCERGVHIAYEMLLWTKDITLFTDGEELVATPKERELLALHGIKVVTQRLSRLVGDEEGEGGQGELAGVVLEDGSRIPLRCIFFNTGRCQRSDLPSKLGLEVDDRGDLVRDCRGNVESVHGLFVAGNCATAPLKLVMTAASQGATVGAKINSELMHEELGLKDGRFYTDSEREAILAS